MNPLIIGSNGAVAAICNQTGEVLWKTSLATGGLISSTRFQDISVLVQDDVVYAGGAGHVFCLDIKNGRVMWHNALKGFGHNDISMAMSGVAVQFLSKVERSSS